MNRDNPCGDFPPIETEADFEVVRRDDARLAQGLQKICRKHGLNPATAERLAGGSLPVYRVDDDRVVKLYPPLDLGGWKTEKATLALLERRLSIPTPDLVAEGQHDGWGYLVMTHLRGTPSSEVWSRISPADRERFVGAVGRGLAELHALDPTPLAAAAEVQWGSFRPRQRAGAKERHRALGLPEPWVEQLEDFVGRHPDPMEAEAHVVLHTEVMREHLLVEPTPGGWSITGLIDFEPSMVGPAEYEFASVGLFVTCGERGLLRRLLGAYGRSPSSELARVFMTHAILHRYSNLRWYLDRMPPPPSIRTLDELADFWWAA